jgi:hypothetical protein
MRASHCSFLDDLERIATRAYDPLDDDIVRARLRTLGVQEYKIRFGEDQGPNSNLLGRSYLGSLSLQHSATLPLTPFSRCYG